MSDNTKRFSVRVADYIKYRPNYPEEIVDILEQVTKINKSKKIADIGSGTGISSILFLKRNYNVIGVEPNREMRTAAEQILSDFKNFKSVEGTAENTNLSDNSVDLIFSGQAFHWFEKEKSKIEFKRILKDNGNIVLVWNSRSSKSSFQKEYEKALFDNIEEYRFVNHRNISESEISNFFFPKTLNKICIGNKQVLDLQGLKGRLLSSSYCPKSGDAHDKLMEKIEQIFDKHQVNNEIEFEYETQIYWC
ncbi:MAG TPA: class I SAM-dependent methyltransferase [Hanamia sp.]|nr:class I SAM-dependent methyltransferase [Hanamia sp.]